MTEPELWVIDRIEDGRHAVLVSRSGKTTTVPASVLPDGAREGDALRVTTTQEAVQYTLDRAETERLKAEAKGLRDSLPRGPSGRLSL